MQYDMYWLLDMYEYGHVLRDRNDLSRRPGKSTPARRYVHAPAPVSGKVVDRHAESSPENPQGGRWVRMRIEQGGMPLDHAQLMQVLAQHGYKPGDSHGTQGR